MERETRNLVIAIVVIVAVVGGLFFGISSGSGVSPAFTVVESQSMQHSNESELGIIDTGDMVLVKSTDKIDIRSYVDGYCDGYSTFGEYGNVIIYERGANYNPVIHRAILWLDFVETNEGDIIWKAPSLKDYPSNLWSCTEGHDYNNLKGTFTMYDVGCFDKNVSVNLNNIGTKSGYLTMGDNTTNPSFDQPGIIGTLVTPDIIKSVAWIEIPWIGCIKLTINGNDGNIDKWVPNSIPCLAVAAIALISVFTAINILFDYRDCGRFRKYLEEELIDSPTPLFPVEPENKGK